MVEPSKATSPWIEKKGASLTWHLGATAILFADDADEFVGSAITDGGHVIYWGNGVGKVWDSQQPDAPAWELPGTFQTDLPMQFLLKDGVVWFTQVDDFNKAPADMVTTVSRIDLAQGRTATEVMTGKNLTIGSLIDDGLQVRVDAEPFVLLKADGSQTPLQPPLSDHRISEVSGSTYRLDSPNGTEGLLYEPGGELRALDSAGWIDSGWAYLSNQDKYGDKAVLHNLTTNVRVVLPDANYLPRYGYLFKTHINDWGTPELPVAALKDLPPVSCDGPASQSPEQPVSPATEPTSFRPLAAASVCTVDTPPAWRELITNAGQPSALDGPWLEKSEATLTWHDGAQTHVVGTDADLTYGLGETDGRYVGYLTGTSFKIWDSQHPEEPAWAIEGDFGGDTPGTARIIDGMVWLVALDNWDQPQQDVTTTISVVELAKGRDIKQVLQSKDVTVGAPFGGGLQIRVGDGEFGILKADGGVESLPPAVSDKYFASSFSGPFGDVALVLEDTQNEPNSKRWIYGSGELVTIEDATAVDGEWALRSVTLDMRDHYYLYNYYTGVTVELPTEQEQVYTLNNDHLWVPSGAVSSFAPVALSKLPEVTCG